ncbi:MAG: glycerophosphodiester phosphodiesterase family protein [Cyclobacteriaceae bacterium]
MTSRFLTYATPFLLLFVGLSLFEPYLYRSIFASTSVDALEGKEFMVIAHKGASKQAPENTISAIQRALDLRVDMIEIDVRHTKDEELIVFHDQTLDRVARDSAGHHVTGDVHDFTLEELKQFDIGSWFATPYSKERIPTLKEVLDLVNAHNQEFNDDVVVLCEIKHMEHPHYHDFAEKMVEVIRSEPNGEDWIFVQSYENEYLEDIHELDSLVQTKQLMIGEDSPPLIAFYSETRIHLGHAKESNRMKALNPEWKTLSPRRIFRMHARGYEVYTYSDRPDELTSREDMLKMLNAGVDGIITDNPEVLLEIRDEIRALSK